MGKPKNRSIFDMTSEEIQSKIEQYLPIRKNEKDKNHKRTNSPECYEENTNIKK